MEKNQYESPKITVLSMEPDERLMDTGTEGIEGQTGVNGSKGIPGDS